MSAGRVLRGAVRALGACAALACGDAEPVAPAVVDDCPQETALTWQTFGEGYVRTWCAPCHSASLPVERRYGAPLTMNFDTYADVVGAIDAITGAATGDDPRMPPAGGPSDEDRALFAEWLGCGAPGADDPIPAACEGPPRIAAGDLVVDDTTDMDAFCASANGVAGAVEVRGVPAGGLRCLCTVGGDLSITSATAAEVDLVDLVAVGGHLAVAKNPVLATFAADALVSVGSAVNIDGNTSLTRVELPRLTTVGGALTVADNPALTVLSLGDLEGVGGDLRIERNAALPGVNGGFQGMGTLGGQLVVAGNPSLAGIYWFEYLASLPGGLTIEDNATLASIAGFDHLAAVGGALTLAANGALTDVDGFGALATTGGLVLRDNLALAELDGFGALVDAGAVSIVGNGALAKVPGISGLTALDGLEVRNNPALETLPPLEGVARVAGDVRITDNDALRGLSLLTGATALDGTLEIARNGALLGIDGLDAAETIGGDVLVTENPALAYTAPISALRQVDGALRVEDNDALVDGLVFPKLRHINGDVAFIGNAVLRGAAAMPLLEGAGGIHLVDDPALVEADFPILANIDGELLLRGVGFADLTPFQAVTTVSGNLGIGELPALTQLGTLALDRVGGSLRIVGNPALPSAEADALVAAIDPEDIGGRVVIAGNLDESAR